MPVWLVFIVTCECVELSVSEYVTVDFHNSTGQLLQLLHNTYTGSPPYILSLLVILQYMYYPGFEPTLKCSVFLRSSGSTTLYIYTHRLNDRAVVWLETEMKAVGDKAALVCLGLPDFPLFLPVFFIQMSELYIPASSFFCVYAPVCMLY